MAASPDMRVSEVLERYGRCVELVPMDAHFEGISVGLYAKDGVFTLWSFSRKPGVRDRLRAVRDQLVALGGLVPVDGTDNQVVFPAENSSPYVRAGRRAADRIRPQCGYVHQRLIKFLVAQAVGKSPDYSPPEGEMSIRDTRTRLTIVVAGEEAGDRYVYNVSTEGDAPNVPARLRMIVAGFLRYGEMEREGDTSVVFPCGQRHDGLVRLLLPYSRNVSSVESMLEAEALRGQMTTGTLGFTPT